MRILDIITESIINEASWWNYKPGTYFNISGGADGQKLTGIIQQSIPDFNPDERLTKVGPRAPGKKVPIIFGKDSGEYLFLSRPNGQIIKIIGAAKKIGSALNHGGSAANAKTGKEEVKSKVNLGDISEGVLGAALYAKLLARTGQGIADITSKDVWDVINSSTTGTEANGITWHETSKDIGGAIDKISYRMRIKNQASRALKDPANFNKINNTIVESSVSFVNGRYGTKYAESIYLNRKADEIGIVSDGLSDQKADPVTGLVKKTDVFITSTNDQGQKVKERLPISLKAGSSVKQFGQVSGKTFDKMIGLLKPFNIDVSSLQGKWNKVVKGSNMSVDSIRGAEAIFPDIAKMINERLRGPKAEANFVHNVASAIHYFAASNDPKVRLVQLVGADKVHVLNTNLLFEKIKHKDINLHAVATTGDGKAKITIKDLTSGKPLVSLRSYHTDNAQRNIIEMEKLMKELCGVDWEREFGKGQAVPAKTPVAKTKAAVPSPKPKTVAPVPARTINKKSTTPDINMDIDPSLKHEPHPDDHIPQP